MEFYKADSLESEGFIHCSTIAQLVGTANLIFKGHTDLVLLLIDTTKVAPEIKYENTVGGEELFPHVYGALNIDAVQKVITYLPNAEGEFELPNELA